MSVDVRFQSLFSSKLFAANFTNKLPLVRMGLCVTVTVPNRREPFPAYRTLINNR